MWPLFQSYAIIVMHEYRLILLSNVYISFYVLQFECPIYYFYSFFRLQVVLVSIGVSVV